MGFETCLYFFHYYYPLHCLLLGLDGFPLDDFLKWVLCIPHLKAVAGQIEVVENGVMVGVLYVSLVMGATQQGDESD